MGGFNYNGEGATSSGLSSPSASDVANQFNSFGGTQIRASDVSNIRSDGNGGYMADIRGQIHTVSSEEGSTTQQLSVASMVSAVLLPVMAEVRVGRGHRDSLSLCITGRWDTGKTDHPGLVITNILPALLWL
jgi:hypothetical protein